MISRRAVLVGGGALALSQLLAGCSGPNADLRVRVLKDSIPPQVLAAFRRQLQQPAQLDVKPEPQLQSLFDLLKGQDSSTPGGWRRFVPLPRRRTRPSALDLVTLGDFWLAEAVEKQLIQPLAVEQLAGWQQLPERWQVIARRNRQGQLAPAGQVWGAPYRWGATAIAYRRDKFAELGWTPQDWEDLWREEVRDRISVLNHPRETIGLTLKKLGYSYNTTDLERVPNLEAQLLALHQQVKFYSSDAYLQPLILGDTWLAVGWSSDIAAAQTRYPQIAAVLPRSGTSLWADLWVHPASGGQTLTLSELSAQWIDFCWQPRSAEQISRFTQAASPILLSVERTELPEDLREDLLLLPEADILEQSEFLSPLPASAREQYLTLWRKIRLS